ncbi:MAG: Crp/Fnr family transcriptional regulator [Magnetospiraceae bacterium]
MSGNSEQDLSGVELLCDLSADALVELSQNCRWRTYGAGEQIIDRQSESRDVYFVVNGRVRVVIYSLSGREVTLDDLESGGYFGELAAIDGQPRSASVMAISKTVLASMSPGYFEQTLKKYPEVAVRVMQRLAWVVRMSTERIMELSTLGANNRIQAEILRLAAATATDEGVAIIKPIPIHSDIASRVSTTRETVARELSNLARAGVLERQKDQLKINDLERLRDMVEEVRGE